MSRPPLRRKLSYHDELPDEDDSLLLTILHRIIRFAVMILAVLMVAVIVWGIGDVIYVLYDRLTAPPYLLLNIKDILQTFSAFIAVLIAIELFINIRLYLGSYVVPVQLVLATALMAIARKVIVIDFDEVSVGYVYGVAAVTLALGVTYWLVSREARHDAVTKPRTEQADPSG